jgi:hypothetical protein
VGLPETGDFQPSAAQSVKSVALAAKTPEFYLESFRVVSALTLAARQVGNAASLKVPKGFHASFNTD